MEKCEAKVYIYKFSLFVALAIVVWFLEPAIASAGPTALKVTWFQIPPPDVPSALAPFPNPQVITSGPDGALWFTYAKNDFPIGRLTTNGKVSFYPTTKDFTRPSDASPSAIISGRDGALWFLSGATVGRMSTSGDLKIFAPIHPFGVGGPLPAPGNIAIGGDRAVWFTDGTTSKIGRATAKGVTEYTIPTQGSNAGSIAAARDGSLWFTESTSTKIGRVSLSGKFKEYDLRAVDSNLTASPGDITAGPDGALWFTLAGYGGGPYFIGRITTSGKFTEYPLPSSINVP